ncbi:MAG TPA: prepilin peptidase [Methanocorpusculum sp.]|nr:prepilin peptidase [Methanocorpusculum sp.]
MNDLLPLAVPAVAVLLTFLYASWQDIKTRTVATATWYPAAVVGGVVVLYFWYLQFQHPTTTAISVLALSVVICILMWGCAKAGLFGLADAKAMILLAATVPVNPFAAWLFPSLALSTLVNAGVIALLVPAALLIRNTIRKEHAPFWLMCSGMQVAGDSLTRNFGFVAEEITDGDPISRRFLPAASSIRALKENSACSIRNLREHPERFEKELELYRKAGRVWITYGIPFMIPITIGYILALAGFSLPDAVLSLII